MSVKQHTGSKRRQSWDGTGSGRPCAFVERRSSCPYGKRGCFPVVRQLYTTAYMVRAISSKLSIVLSGHSLPFIVDIRHPNGVMNLSIRLLDLMSTKMSSGCSGRKDWGPRLGKRFGTLHVVLSECYPVQKKVARAAVHNHWGELVMKLRLWLWPTNSLATQLLVEKECLEEECWCAWLP